ncbi:MAG: hypothetical protein ACFE8J_14640, partial [Candidatus Heimdallarchaeota archaeon]
KPSWYTLNTTWYSLDEGETNYSYTGPIDKINQTVWDSAEDGDVKITFYANDSLGFIDSSEITIQKDSIAPNISILLPITNETFNASAPNFTVVISDIHLESMWYSIDGGIVNVSFISNTTIEPIEWNKLLNGTYLLTFYANDSVGNIASASVIIKKIIYEHLEDGKDGQEVILYTVIISSSIILTLGVISYTYLKLKKIKNNKIKEI